MVAFAILLMAISLGGCSTDIRPNLLIIHTDEHSFRTLGCYRALMSEDQGFVWGTGNNVETPHIDVLAAQGALFPSYYATTPVCTPSRASLMTGLYPQTTGAPKNGMYLKKDIKTFAQVLQEQGYAMSYVGKWHLEGEGKKYTFNIKCNAGFDDNRYMMHGGHAPYFHLTPDGVQGTSVKAAAKLPQDELIHVTDYFTDRALEILERDKQKPFCLMLSIPDPHTPDHARPPYGSMYSHMEIQPPKTRDPELLKLKPQWGIGNEGDPNEGKPFIAEAVRQYFGMVKHIDDSVGRLMDFLEENELTDNTIVVFTADHGDMFFEHNRTNKGVAYEASTKIPFIIRYPDKIKPGKIIKKTYTNADFAPTILGLMGIPGMENVHGINDAVTLMNDAREIVDDRIIYITDDENEWVIAQDTCYKLVVSNTDKPWLLDLEKDPDEIINYYNQPEYSDIAAKLMAELKHQMHMYGELALEAEQPLIYE